MITEDYCSFELSKLLKEKGFDCPCHGSYHIEYPENKIVWSPKPVNDDGQIFINAPTHQMAMKWLRCEGIYIEIDILGKTNIKYGFTILKLNEGEIYSDDKTYITYEKAVEAALKYVLENLI